MAPKPRPRRPKTAPRCAQDMPKTTTWPQLGAQVAPKTGQDSPKTTQDGPNHPRVDHTFTAGRREMLARWHMTRIARTLPRIAEILPRTKPRTRTLPTTPQERLTSKRSAAKLPADRRAPELQSRGAAVLPPRAFSINLKHLLIVDFKINSFP